MFNFGDWSDRFSTNRPKVDIVTARKRSLGQGNIFTPVCHSVHRGGMRGCFWGGCAWLLLGGCAWLLQGGMHGCSQGACVAKGGMRREVGRAVCVAKWEGVHGMHPQPPPTRYGRSLRGRYASYWNAFLFYQFLQLSSHIKFVSNSDLTEFFT